MTDDRLSLRLDLSVDVNADDVERTRLTQQLRRQLLELDVEQVALARDSVSPTGTKSADAVTTGALLVTLAPTALAGALNLVQTWVSRHATSSVEVSLPGKSITLTGGRRSDTQRLVDAFLDADDTGGEPAGG